VTFSQRQRNSCLFCFLDIWPVQFAMVQLKLNKQPFARPFKGTAPPKKILRGILCYQGSSRIRRQPVTPGVLLAIRPILRSWLGPWDFSMIWAAFTVAFFALLRCSEFTYPWVHSFSSKFNLTKECATFCPSLACPQRLLVIRKSSKMDSLGQGNPSSLPVVLLCSALSQQCNNIL